jgi:GNAT superfamily N-acetyltransferase
MKIEIATAEYSNQLSELVLSASEELRGIDFNEEGWNRFLSANTPRELDKRLCDSAFKVFCCVELGQILGFIAIKDHEKIDQLFVLPDARNRGVARLLWETAKQNALENGAFGKFWLRSSSVAMPVYQKFGFKPEGERQVFGGIRFQLMRL